MAMAPNQVLIELKMNPKSLTTIDFRFLFFSSCNSGNELGKIAPTDSS